MTDLENLLAEARAERDRLNVSLGELLTGDAPEKEIKAAKGKLAKADAAVSDLVAHLEAIEAAKAKALRDEEERKERERKAELDRLIASFSSGHKRFSELAGKADEKFDEFLEAVTEMEQAGFDLVKEHRALNLNANAVNVIMSSGWTGQIFNNMRNYGSRGMRNWWANFGRTPVGSGNRVKIASIIPSLPMLFGGKGEAA